jgi:hypothetical protein
MNSTAVDRRWPASTHGVRGLRQGTYWQARGPYQADAELWRRLYDLGKGVQAVRATVPALGVVAVGV